MKITPRDVEKFLRNPGPGILAVLAYGPDSGLVGERTDLVARSVVNDLTDPFLVSEFTESELLKDPSRLGDEAASLTLTGERRVVRIRDATDAVSAIVEMYLENGRGEALIVLRSGDLGPRSKLRRQFEQNKKAAALACYADDDRTLEQIIRNYFLQNEKTLTPEAVTYLVANLGVDRAVSRTELTKLAIYLGDERVVTLDAAMDCVGDSSAFSLESLAFAVGDGDQLAVSRTYTRCLEEGAGEVAVIRITQRHFTRLQFVLAELAKSGDTERAMQSLRPAVFFKFKERFRRQVQKWRAIDIEWALSLLLDAEHTIKQTGTPVSTICGHALLQVAEIANPGNPKLK